jgi:hypothetical protein
MQDRNNKSELLIEIIEEGLHTELEPNFCGKFCSPIFECK